jgi:hypothetical protein
VALSDVLGGALALLRVVPPKGKPGEEASVPFRLIEESESGSESDESVELEHQIATEEGTTHQDQAHPSGSPTNDPQAPNSPESNDSESETTYQKLAENVKTCRTNFAQIDAQLTAHLVQSKLEIQRHIDMHRRLAKKSPQTSTDELLTAMLADQEIIGEAWESDTRSLRRKWIEAEQALVDAEQEVH